MGLKGQGGCLQISSQHHFFAFLRDVHSESAPVLYENDSSGIRSIITLYILIGFERCGDTGSVSCASSAQPLRFHKCVCFEGGGAAESEGRRGREVWDYLSIPRSKACSTLCPYSNDIRTEDWVLKMRIN